MWDVDVKKVYVTFVAFAIVAFINKNNEMYDIMNEAKTLIDDYYKNNPSNVTLINELIFYKKKVYDEYKKELCDTQKGGFYYKYIKYKNMYYQLKK